VLRPLPLLIGSEEFIENETVGLLDLPSGIVYIRTLLRKKIC